MSQKKPSFPQVSFAIVTGQYGWYSIFASIFALPMTLRFLTSQEIMVLAAPSPSLWGLFRVVKTLLECILSPPPDVQLERFVFRLPAESDVERRVSRVLTLCVSVLCLPLLPMNFCCPVKDLGESTCRVVSDAHTFLRPRLFCCLLQSFRCSHPPPLLPPGRE